MIKTIVHVPFFPVFLVRYSPLYMGDVCTRETRQQVIMDRHSSGDIIIIFILTENNAPSSTEGVLGHYGRIFTQRSSPLSFCCRLNCFGDVRHQETGDGDGIVTEL